MKQPVYVISNKKICNKKGVTLVEVMISLVILLIVFMGLIQASLLSMQSNMKNVLRDEAVRITSDRMARLRSIAFTDALVADTTATPGFVDDDQDQVTAGVQTTITKTVRNAPVTFTVKKIVDDLDANNKQISVNTTWQWQGENFTHTIVATRGR